MEDFVFKIYEKLGEYFTGSQKRNLFYSLLFFILIIVVAVSFRFEILIDAEIINSVLGIVVQSLLALVGLMGVLVVFKYQSMSSYEDNISNHLRASNSSLGVLGGSPNFVGVDGLLKMILNHIGKDPSPGEGWNAQNLRQVKQRLESNIHIRMYMKDYMLKFSVYVFTLTLICLVLMIFMKEIAGLFLGLPLVLFLIYCTSYALFLTIKILAEAVAGE